MADRINDDIAPGQYVKVVTVDRTIRTGAARFADVVGISLRLIPEGADEESTNVFIPWGSVDYMEVPR